MCKIRVGGSLFNYATSLVVFSVTLNKSNRNWPRLL